MTIAEQLIQRGRDESAEALRQAEAEKSQILQAVEAEKCQLLRHAEAEKHQVALNLLHSGLSIEFVAQNTQIDIETLKKLLAEKPLAH